MALQGDEQAVEDIVLVMLGEIDARRIEARLAKSQAARARVTPRSRGRRGRS